MKTTSIKPFSILLVMWLVEAQCVAQTDGTQWGVATNCFMAGLEIHYKRDPNHPVIQCIPLLKYIGTNGEPAKMIRMDVLPVPWRYEMDMLDDKGQTVEKTAAGKELGKPLTSKPRIGARTGYIAYSDYNLNSGSISVIEPFALQKYFDVKRPGKYQLQFVMRAITDTGSTNHVPIYFRVNAEIEVNKQ